MKKKYIDFVPTKGKKASAKQSVASNSDKKVAPKVDVRKTSGQGTNLRSAGVAKTAAPRANVRRPSAQMVEPKIESRAVSRKEPVGVAKLGVVEDLSRNFVNTEVPKRPLGQEESERARLLKEAKAKNLLSKQTAEKVAKPKLNQAGTSATFKTPSTPFINQEKVEKRPLSKNMYNKQPVVKKEVEKAESKGPVTIIAKPEKDAHVSVVVTIIITIILGAAAGTVAFLLLPK